MAHYKRITKKLDIKGPDEFLGFWTRVYFWTQEKKDQLLLPALGLAVAVALAFGFIYYRQQMELSAHRELFEILKDLPRQGAENAATPDTLVGSLKSYSEKYSGTPSGRIAQLYAANILYKKKSLDDAARFYSAVANSGGGLATQMAALGLARTYQEQGKYADAIATLEKFGKDSPFSEEMDFMAARTHELDGKKEIALKEYNKFAEKYPGSPSAAIAHERAAKLS